MRAEDAAARSAGEIRGKWELSRAGKMRKPAKGDQCAGASGAVRPATAEHLAFQKLVSDVVEARNEVLEVLTR
jgi:hypothetical protein